MMSHAGACISVGLPWKRRQGLTCKTPSARKHQAHHIQTARKRKIPNLHTRSIESSPPEHLIFQANATQPCTITRHLPYHISVYMPCHPSQQRISKSWENVALADDRISDWSPLLDVFLGWKFSYSSSFCGFRETCREAQLRHRQINSWAYKIVYVYGFPLPNERGAATISTSTSTTRFFLLLFSSSSPFF